MPVTQKYDTSGMGHWWYLIWSWLRTLIMSLGCQAILNCLCFQLWTNVHTDSGTAALCESLPVSSSLCWCHWESLFTVTVRDSHWWFLKYQIVISSIQTVKSTCYMQPQCEPAKRVVVGIKQNLWGGSNQGRPPLQQFESFHRKLGVCLHVSARVCTYWALCMSHITGVCIFYGNHVLILLE